MRNLFLVVLAMVSITATAQQYVNDVLINSELEFKSIKQTKWNGFNAEMATYATGSDAVVVYVVDGVSRANSLKKIADTGATGFTFIASQPFNLGSAKSHAAFYYGNGMNATKIATFKDNKLVVIVAVGSDAEQTGYNAGYVFGYIAF